MRGISVLYICNYAADYSGNFIAALAKLACEQEKINDVYFLFPIQAKGKCWLNRLPNMEKSVRFSDFQPLELYKACKRLAADIKGQTIVHTHFVENTGMLAVNLCFRYSICHYHMTVPERNTLKRKIKCRINNLICKNTVLIGVSQPVTEDLQKYYKRNKCVCIPNAIDFESLESATSCDWNPTFIIKDSFAILIHGTHFYRKGVDIAVKAVRKINQDTGLRVKLYITSHHPNQTKEEIKALGDVGEYHEVIRVVENIKDLYDCIDVFISPSRQEAFGYAVAEAAYSKCQVVATDVPGQNTMRDIPEIQWVEAENIDGLTSAILKAIENQQKGNVSQIKEKQKTYVKKHYDVANWVTNVMMLYRKVLNES